MSLLRLPASCLLRFFSFFAEHSLSDYDADDDDEDGNHNIDNDYDDDDEYEYFDNNDDAAFTGKILET